MTAKMPLSISPNTMSGLTDFQDILKKERVKREIKARKIRTYHIH